MYMLCTLIQVWGGGGGQMSNTFFESGGKCPPMLIIRGQMTSYTIFYRGANVRGGKCPTLSSLKSCSRFQWVLYSEIGRKPSTARAP